MKKLFERAKTILRGVWNSLTPVGIKCVVCGREIRERPEGLCEKCVVKLPLVGARFCMKCGAKVVGEGEFCESCGRNEHLFDESRCVCEFDGLGRGLVHRLKFGGERYLSVHMAHMMSEVFKNQGWSIDCVVFVPMTENESKKYGYNQAHLLAKQLCDILSLPLVEIVKIRETQSQSKLDFKQRQLNVANAFKIVDKTAFAHKNVLVIDDVKTTGATLDEAARVLKKAGARKVFGLTFASRTQNPDLMTESTKWDF